MLKKQSSCTLSDKEIILASSSPSRVALLRQWGFSFTVMPSNVDETYCLKRPSSIVKNLAFRKASHIAKHNKDKIILAADTIVVLNGSIIGKPKNKAESRKIIKELNGSSHKVYTGVAIICNNKKYIFYDVATVKMRNLSQKELKPLFGKHMDKSGSYAIQSGKDNFVEKIRGDYHTIVGLPYTKLIQKLKKFGVYIKK